MKTHSTSTPTAVACAAVVALLAATVFLSGDVTHAQRGSSSSQPSSATTISSPFWKTYYPAYDAGYPNRLAVGPIYAGASAQYGCGASFCGQTPHCSNPYIGVLSASSGAKGIAGIVQNNAATRMSGSLIIPSGTEVKLEWACTPRRRVQYIDGSQNCTAYAGSVTDFYSQSLTAAGPGGSLYAGNNLIGSATVTVQGNPGDVFNYSLTCKKDSTNKTWKVTVPVRIAADAPTVGITGNGTNPTVAAVGSPVTIRGTFAPAQGDTLVRTALNDYQSNALPGVQWGPPTDKTYVFTPQAPGTYKFYPAVQTTSYPDWDTYGKSLTVTAQCPANSTQSGNTCVCNQYYRMVAGTCVINCPANATASNGTCVCPANANLVGGSCVCSQFYTMQSGSCVINCPANATPSGGTCTCNPGYALAGNTCGLVDACLNLPGVQAAAPQNSTRDAATGNCSCNPGFMLNGTQCVVQPQLDIRANGGTSATVRAGNPAVITWTASNVQPGSCSVRSSTGATLSTGANTNPTPAPSITVQGQTTVTLTCRDAQGGAHSKAVVISVIPSFREI